MAPERDAAMKQTTINRINRTGLATMMDPPTTAVIAMRMGRATAEHYYNIAQALMIASHAADVVARHRHLQDEIGPALEAVAAIHARHEQRTIEDAPYSGTPDEIDAIQNGLEIYRAILQATPGKALLRAINLVRRDVEREAS